MDEESRKRLRDYFEKRNKKISDNNWKQAMVPEGSFVLYNDNGTAPGLIMEVDNKRLILLPGPPNELIPLFEQKVEPYLSKVTNSVIVSKVVKICGIGESMVETMIEDMINAQDNPTIATYAKTGEVHIRVTAAADNEKQAGKLLKPVVTELKNRFQEAVYTTKENVSLEESIVELLVANSLTISTIESCTGGMVAARLINVPGVSEVFKAGYVTYSNKAKRKVLGVKSSTLKKYTAVSEQVAKEMARGVSLVTKADVTVSVTGIAGPDGGTSEKPVGLVYIGCNVKGTIVTEEYNFTGNRSRIRENATVAALTLLRKCVLKYYSEVTFKG